MNVRPSLRERRRRTSLLGLALITWMTTVGAAPRPRLLEVQPESAVDPKSPAPTFDARVPPAAPTLRLRTPTGQDFGGEEEPNSAAGTANPIVGTSRVIQANVFPGTDLDFYSFQANAGDRVYAAVMTSLNGRGLFDSELVLFQPNGITALETDNDDGSFGASSSSIAGAVIPAAGTYYLRVRYNASTTLTIHPYRLYFQLRSGSPTAETEANDTFPGQALPAGGWVSGTTSATTDVDFYSLNLNAGETVWISLDLDPERDTTEWNAQTGLGVFGTPPNVLVVNDAGTATPDSESFFLTAKNAGTYGIFVGVPAGGTTFGTYHLSATVFPSVDEGVNCTTYTSTNVPVAIPTGPGFVTSTLTVPGNPIIGDLDVSVQLDHTFMADLDVQLTAPAGVGGNTVGLFSDIGSVTANAQVNMDTTFDDEAAIPSSFAIVQGLQLAPEFNYRLGWFDGQPAGGTWTLTIRDDATGDGGNLTGWSIRICEPPPPPACAPGFTRATVFSTDFEAGAAGFTSSGTQNEWERGTPAYAGTTTSAAFNGCNSGTNCFKTDLDNTYNASADMTLLSPNINLAGFSPPVVVSWAQKYQVESAAFDRIRLDIQEVGSFVSTRTPFIFLDADMFEAVGATPTVNNNEVAGWGIKSVRADPYAGLNTELRFILTSDTSIQRTGWGIDDVSVTACRPLSADLSITKTDGVTTAVPGQSTTYTITASNAGPDAVTGATVADTFPAACTAVNWTCVGAGGGTCTAAGSGNLNDTVNLPSGGSVTYTAVCAISSAATGNLSNTATVSTTVTDPTPGNNSATDTDVLTPTADLSMTKTDGSATAVPGQSTTYTIVAANAGPSNWVGASVTDNFPAGCTSVSWTCAGAGGGTCAAPNGTGNISQTINLPVGGSTTYTAVCNISAAATGTLVNTASVLGNLPRGVGDPNPGNNTATDTDTLVPTADLGITKDDGLVNATAGQATTYTITVTNPGPSNAPGTAVADTFPAGYTVTGWTCAGAGGATCTSAGTGNIADTANLPAASSVVYTVSGSIGGAFSGSLANTATTTAGSGVTDPATANNAATDTTLVGTGPTVSGSKVAAGDFVPNGEVTYTITLTNTGDAAQGDNPGDELTDVLPADLTLVSASASSGTANANLGTNTVTWNGTIPGGGSVTITIVATINGDVAEGAIIANQATIAYDSNGDGTNETSIFSDDPSLGGRQDPTDIVVGGGVAPVEIPTLSVLGLAALMLLLAGAAFLALRRRRMA